MLVTACPFLILCLTLLKCSTCSSNAYGVLLWGSVTNAKLEYGLIKTYPRLTAYQFAQIPDIKRVGRFSWTSAITAAWIYLFILLALQFCSFYMREHLIGSPEACPSLMSGAVQVAGLCGWSLNHSKPAVITERFGLLVCTTKNQKSTEHSSCLWRTYK